MRYAGSGSLKALEFGISQTGIHDCLLATNSDFGYISHFPSYRNVKVENCLLDTLISFNTMAGGDPLWMCLWTLD